MKGLSKLELWALEVAADDHYLIDNEHPDTPKLELALGVVKDRGLITVAMQGDDIVYSITAQGRLALRVCLVTS